MLEMWNTIVCPGLFSIIFIFKQTAKLMHLITFGPLSDRFFPMDCRQLKLNHSLCCYHILLHKASITSCRHNSILLVSLSQDLKNLPPRIFAPDPLLFIQSLSKVPLSRSRSAKVFGWQYRLLRVRLIPSIHASVMKIFQLSGAHHIKIGCIY